MATSNATSIYTCLTDVIQLPAFGGDVWNSRADQVKAIARSTADKYQGNPSQIYLTGFSYGGNGVLDIGFRQRDVWAAL